MSKGVIARLVMVFPTRVGGEGRDRGAWAWLTGVGFLQEGQTWEYPEGEEEEDNEEAMQRGAASLPYTPHPTPHTHVFVKNLPL